MRPHVVAALAVCLAGAAAHAAPTPAAIDAVFARYTAATPGCDVAIDQAGEAPIIRAYGSADLEHDAPNRADTVFEAGSVSKQFTAAAILLLAADGRLALDDDVRRYIPELPDYGTPITLTMLLGHTSGLRDWGDVEALAGWPRTERVYSLADVLAIAARQTSLNYRPGAAWSYTNTGYNLLAMIVERVSGKSLPAFSRERLFGPLGMTHTSWRDDFRRVTPGRAVAYAKTPSGWEQLMPFENAIGNGGLLTTVGDLMIWNRAIAEGRLGAFVAAEQVRRTPLTDGRITQYARGLFITSHRGFAEISHSGATAGYRAWLGRFPAQGLSIALLCNAGDASPALAYAVADLFLPSSTPRPATASAVPKGPALARWAGWYRDDRSGEPLQLTVEGGTLKTDSGQSLGPAPDGGLELGRRPVTLLSDGRLQFPETGDVDTYLPVAGFEPGLDDLQKIVGRYRSAEADADFVVSRKGDRLSLAVADRPDSAGILTPAYVDAFTWTDGVVRLVRGADGRVTALRLSDGRVWDLRAERMD
jgi:CubicO group peptidase (beta-lactamase class C family)